MRSRTPEYRAAYWRKWAAANCPKVHRECCICGASFGPRASQKRCDACRSLTCDFCKAKFISPNSRMNQRFCSRICKDASLRGFEPTALARNRGRKPRTRFAEHRDRCDAVEDREWRTSVFLRDDFTCQICKTRGQRLQADHIFPVATHPELRHDLANGRTLCVACHRKTPTFGWHSYWAKIAAKRCSQEVFRFGVGNGVGA